MLFDPTNNNNLNLQYLYKEYCKKLEVKQVNVNKTNIEIHKLFRKLEKHIPILQKSRHFQEELIRIIVENTNLNTKEDVTAINDQINLKSTTCENALYSFVLNKVIYIETPHVGTTLEFIKCQLELDFADIKKKRAGVVKKFRFDLKEKTHQYLRKINLLNTFTSLIHENNLNISVQILTQCYLRNIDKLIKNDSNIENLDMKNYRYIKYSSFILELGNHYQRSMINVLLPPDFFLKIKVIELLKIIGNFFDINFKMEPFFDQIHKVFLPKLSYKTLYQGHLLNIYKTFLYYTISELMEYAITNKDIFDKYQDIFNIYVHDCNIEDLQKLNFICKQELKKLAMNISTDYLEYLISADIFTKEVKIIENKAVTVISLKEKILFFNATTQLPTFYPLDSFLLYNQNSFTDNNKPMDDIANIRETKDIFTQEFITQYKCLFHPQTTLLKDNDNIIGNIKKPLKVLLNRESKKSLFCINLKFSIEFLTTLLNILETGIEQILKNTTYLEFLQEIYGFKIPVSMPKHIKIKVLEIMINFKTVYKSAKSFFKLFSSTEDKLYFETYETYFCKIFALIYSKKFSFRDLLIQINVCNGIRYFSYNNFVDGRGRKYERASSLNPKTNPLARPFISFYRKHTIKKMALRKKEQIKNPKMNLHKILKKDPMISIINRNLNNPKILSNFIESTQNLLFKQIIAHYPKYNREAFSFTDVLNSKDIALGKRFHVYNLIYDYVHFIKDPQNYIFHSTYSLDSSMSGYHMLAILQNSENIAKMSNLIQGAYDGYTLFSDFAKKLQEEFQEFFHMLAKVYPDLFNYVLEEVLPIFKYTKNKIEKEELQEELQACYMHMVDNWDLDVIMEQHNCVLLYHKTIIIEEIMNKEYAKTLVYIIKDLYILTDADTSINRKIAKLPVMTLPYASTAYRIQITFAQGIMDQNISQGLLFTNDNINKYKKISRAFTKFFIIWGHTNLSSATSFLKTIKHFCRNHKWNIFNIEYKFFSYYYKPFVKTLQRIQPQHHKKNKNNTRIYITESTNKVDYYKLGNAYTANYIHAADATIIYYFMWLVEMTNAHLSTKIQFFTIHDCYYIHPLFALDLRSLVQEAYLRLFNDMPRYNIFNRLSRRIGRIKKDIKHLQKMNLLAEKNISYFQFLIIAIHGDRKKISNRIKTLFTHEDENISDLINLVINNEEKAKITSLLDAILEVNEKEKDDLLGKIVNLRTDISNNEKKVAKLIDLLLINNEILAYYNTLTSQEKKLNLTREKFGDNFIKS